MPHIAKQFNKMSAPDLFNYFQQKNYQANKPLLISLDGDQTIVNRNKGSHFMSRAVIKMFKKLRKNKQFILTMNTGRDLTNYAPLQKQTGHREPNILLSGRIIYYQGKAIIDKKALFSKSLKIKLWRQFVDGSIPFLDVKHKKGNTFFVKKSRNLTKYYGHHRPLDWFRVIKMNIMDIDINKETENIFYALDIVRAEIPFLLNSQNAGIIKAINNKDQRVVKKYALANLDLENSVDLMFIPAPTHKSRQEIVKKIGSIRILIHDKYVNKGTGLHWLAKLINIPPANIVYFGDSAEDKANDIIVKKLLPSATLIITGNGGAEAKKIADFTVESVARDGVPKAVDKLIDFQKRYSQV